MTFSILALDARTGAIGGAAMTGNLAVGAWVLRVAARVGAVATQGHSVSPLWGDECLQRLQKFESAEKIVASVTGRDCGRAYRQLSVLDRQGMTAAFTGEQNTQARGHRLQSDCVIAGNWLSSADVLVAMQDTYTASLDDKSLSLAERLLAALDAGVRTGGDSRGMLSAALNVARIDQPPLDLRVDYHEQPLVQLRELHQRATAEPYASWMQYVPTLKEPFRF